MSARRWWLAVGAGVIVVVAVILIAVLRGRAPDASTNANAPAAPAVSVVVARVGVVAERIAAQGRVGPPAGSSAKIAFAQSGILARVFVHVGDAVTAGQTVAELDRSALAASLAGARADFQTAGGGGAANPAIGSASARFTLAATKLQTLQRGGAAAASGQIAAASAARQAALKVDADRSALTRTEELLAGGVVAVKDVDAARAQLASDEADQRSADARVAVAATDFNAALDQARADVASARNDVQSAGGQAAAARARLDGATVAYANGALSAPAAGVVLAVLKHPGEAVDPTQPVVEIGPPLGHSVTLTVPADAAARIAVGDPVSLATGAARERVTQGSVTAVVPAVDPTTQVGTIVVGGEPPGALPGDAVSATITVGRARGVVVPTTAIVQDPQTGRTVVFVRDAAAAHGSAQFHMRTVSVAATDATRTAIGAGLRPGERVAAQGGYALLAPAGG